LRKGKGKGRQVTNKESVLAVQKNPRSSHDVRTGRDGKVRRVKQREGGVGDSELGQLTEFVLREKKTEI